MVSEPDALEVLKHLPLHHPCVKVNRLAQLRILSLVKCVDEEAFCFPLRRIECVPVGDASAMYGFGFGADYTGRTVGNRFVVYFRAFRTGERCTESLGVVGLVHYKADEVVFPPFLVKLDGIEDLR